MSLEDEVDIVSKLYSFSVGKSEQVVIIQDRVERLNPIRIHISIANDPRSDVLRLLTHYPLDLSQYSIIELPGIVVQVAKKHGSLD